MSTFWYVIILSLNTQRCQEACADEFDEFDEAYDEHLDEFEQWPF